MRMKQTEEKITALYARLSRDDDNAGDSNSIEMCIRDRYRVYGVYGNFEVRFSFSIRQRIDHNIYTERLVCKFFTLFYFGTELFSV